jgi:hypothetical protein
MAESGLDPSEGEISISSTAGLCHCNEDLNVLSRLWVENSLALPPNKN